MDQQSLTDGGAFMDAIRKDAQDSASGRTLRVPFKPGEVVLLKRVAFEVVMCDAVDGQGVLLLRAAGRESGPIPNRKERRAAARKARRTQ